MRVIKELLEDNLIANYENIKKAYPGVKKVYAVVKANAYGNGAKEVIKVLNRYEEVHFIVANTQEANEVKKLTTDKEILLVGGVSKDYFDEIVDNNYLLGISSEEEVKNITEFLKVRLLNDNNNKINDEINGEKQINDKENNVLKQKTKMKVHLKINTGMNRLGFDLFDEDKFKKEISNILKNEYIDVKGIYSHLSETDNEDILKIEEARFDKGVELFKEVLEELKMRERIEDITIHLLASSGIFNRSLKAYDALRPGIALYGYYSTAKLKEKWEEKYDKLKPTVRIKSRLNLIREVKKGEYISYVSSFKAVEDMKIGIVESGYDDGYMRSYSNKARVKVRGKFAKVVGIVCMNLFMIDLTDIDAEIGDDVILLDEEIDADELANIAGTINDEVLCNFK